MERRNFIKLTSLSLVYFSTPNLNFLIPEQRKKIHIIGLGSAGCNIIEYVFKKRFDANYTYVTTPDRTHFLNGINKVTFNRPKEYRNNKNWINDKDVLTENIKSIFQKDEYYIIVTGLRGYTGSLLMRDLNKFLLKQNKLFTAIASTPFKFEGKMFMENANKIVEDIRNNPDFILIDLEIVRKIYGNITIIEAYEKANHLFYKKIIEIYNS